MAQLLLHTPQDGVENIGWLSQFGNNIRVSFAQEYIENPNRLTLSQVFIGGNETQTLEILRARDDERLVRIARLPGYFGNLLPEGHNRDRLAKERGATKTMSSNCWRQQAMT
jgi:serine/threonine-protein kinase HipA